MIFWIVALIPSASALEMPDTAALMTASQWFLIILATFLIGSSLLRIAQLYQRVQRRSAHPRRT